jgi:hypothetical protein
MALAGRPLSGKNGGAIRRHRSLLSAMRPSTSRMREPWALLTGASSTSPRFLAGTAPPDGVAVHIREETHGPGGGPVRPSFVPPKSIRDLRDLTRYRKVQIEDRGREAQRLDRVPVSRPSPSVPTATGASTRSWNETSTASHLRPRISPPSTPLPPDDSTDRLAWQGENGNSSLAFALLSPKCAHAPWLRSSANSTTQFRESGQRARQPHRIDIAQLLISRRI